MLVALRSLDLERYSPGDRNAVLTSFQEFLVEKVREYHGRRRVHPDYDPTMTTWMGVHEILGRAQQDRKGGPVAQYLVGAKLALRFPGLEVANERYSAADVPSKRAGDFIIGDTVFHVTISPTPGLYMKCERNIADGFGVYVLVPNPLLVGTRQNADGAVPGKIAVESLESFISQNLEEMSCFSKDKRISGFRRLLETYNARVDAIETDKSLMIEIPRALV
jgi:hypothetical protein